MQKMMWLGKKLEKHCSLQKFSYYKSSLCKSEGMLRKARDRKCKRWCGLERNGQKYIEMVCIVGDFRNARSSFSNLFCSLKTGRRTAYCAVESYSHKRIWNHFFHFIYFTNPLNIFCFKVYNLCSKACNRYIKACNLYFKLCNNISQVLIIFFAYDTLDTSRASQLFSLF